MHDSLTEAEIETLLVAHTAGAEDTHAGTGFVVLAAATVSATVPVAIWGGNVPAAESTTRTQQAVTRSV